MRARRSRKDCSINVAPGFTLVELVMVIVILGIISATLLPRFASLNTFSDRIFFDDLWQSLNYARDISLARGCRVQVVIFSNDFYAMQDDDCDTSSYQRSDFTVPLMRPDQTERLEYYKFDQQGHADIATASVVVVFNPNGTVTRDVSGSLVSFSSWSVSVGSRSLSLYGDTAYVQ